MSFTDAVNNAMSVLFADGFADVVQLNGSDVNAHILDQGHDDDSNSMFDFVEIEFLLSDYPTVKYATDKVDISGTTWSYPREITEDASTRVVRFINNQRPIHSGRARR